MNLRDIARPMVLVPFMGVVLALGWLYYLDRELDRKSRMFDMQRRAVHCSQLDNNSLASSPEPMIPEKSSTR